MALETEELPPLPAAWEAVSGTEAAGLVAELQSEAIPGHPLFGVPVRAVAAATGNDDVLFRHQDEPDRFTVAHLTWRQGPEIDARHPTVEFAGTWAQFVAEQQRIEDWLRENL